MQKMINVLYIDDERTNRVHFKLIFSRWYNVFLAEDARQALRCMEDNPIDIIFSDQMLADTCGTALMRQIHRIREDIPKLIITGFMENEDIDEAISDGIIKKVIRKPFDFKDVRDMIEELVP